MTTPPTDRGEPPEESVEPAADALDESLGVERRTIKVRRDVKQRLDVYLQQRLKGISRSRIQKLIELRGVTVNHLPAKPSTTIHAGDVIDIILPPASVRTIEPEPIPVNVVYEDDSFIIINKQADLVVHPARSNLNGTLLNGLAYRFARQREEAGQAWKPHKTRGFSKQESSAIEGLSEVGAEEFRPGIVHRLDRNTTGVLVVAKNDQAHWAIARQFENRTTLKAYLAVVHGNFDSAGGVIDQPLGKHPTIREACAVRHDSSARNAVTLYRVREQYDGYSLVELELKTGRTHQIRVHLSYTGHPIVGDLLYGGEPVGQTELDTPPIAAGSRAFLTYAREKEEGRRIAARANARPDLITTLPALHATLLRFAHPISAEQVTFTAAVHEPLRSLIHAMRSHPGPGPVATEGYWVDLSAAVPPA